MINFNYIAGLFDGEGTIGIYRVGKRNWAARMAIVGTHRPMIETVYRYFRIGKFTTQKRQSIERTPRGDYNPNGLLCKQGWIWFITSRKELKIFIDSVFPYLIEKKEQVEIVKDFLEGKLDGETASILCKKAKRFNFPKDNFIEQPRRYSGMKGSENPMAKLTDRQVEKIRKLKSNGTKTNSLTKMFNVSRHTIWRVVTHKNYG